MRRLWRLWRRGAGKGRRVRAGWAGGRKYAEILAHATRFKGKKGEMVLHERLNEVYAHYRKST